MNWSKHVLKLLSFASDVNLKYIVGAKLYFGAVPILIDFHLFSHFSDIDLVVVGLWESLPLRTLEHRLLERNIADPATIKVIIHIIMMALV